MLSLKSLILVPLALQTCIVKHLHLFICFLLGSFELFLLDQHSKKLPLGPPGDALKHPLRGIAQMVFGVFVSFWQSLLCARIQVVSHFLENGADLGSRHRDVVRIDDVYLVELLHGLFENLASLEWKNLNWLRRLQYLREYLRALVGA